MNSLNPLSEYTEENAMSDRALLRSDMNVTIAVRSSGGPCLASVWAAALLVWVCTPLPCFAQQVVSASADITIQLGAANLTIADHAVAVDNQLGVVALQSLGAIPEWADVTGYADAGGGTFLFSVDTTVTLSGGVVASPNDVVAWNGAVHSILYDGSVQGIPSGVQIDAISTSTSNGLVLSFDTDVSLPGGITAADEDLVRVVGSTYTMVLDGSTVGVDRALDIDGAQDIGGGYLVSFDTSGTVGGITFQDEDILRYVGGTWSLEFDGSNADSDWGPADLDAFHVPEPAGWLGLLSGVLAITGWGRWRRS